MCVDESQFLNPHNEKMLLKFFQHKIRDHWTAEDLVQDVFLRFIRNKPGEEIRTPMAYLYGIAHHVLTDHIIELKERQKEEVTDHSIVHGDTHDFDVYEVVQVEFKLDDELYYEQRIKEAIAQLPETHAEVIVRHKMLGQSYEEVAEELKLSIHTVEKYVTQAKKILRGVLADEAPKKPLLRTRQYSSSGTKYVFITLLPESAARAQASAFRDQGYCAHTEYAGRENLYNVFRSTRVIKSIKQVA